MFNARDPLQICLTQILRISSNRNTIDERENQTLTNMMTTIESVSKLPTDADQTATIAKAAT